MKDKAEISEVRRLSDLGTPLNRIARMMGFSKNTVKKIVYRIEGYEKDNKTFGGASCHKARINNINGAIIIPDLTKHKDIVEFIAPLNLKSELKIKDGDKIKIELIS